MILTLSLYSNLKIMGESELDVIEQRYDDPNSVSTKGDTYLPTTQGIEKDRQKNANPNLEKAVIIMFDRGYETQFFNAKPILDKYGFKASFFIICSFVNGDGYYELENGEEVRSNYSDKAMTWEQIRTLFHEGHDIESHGFEHKDLRNLSMEELENEISLSKTCLMDNGFKPSYFQNPNNRGGDNSTILKIISKYFDFGLSGHARLMFLNCDGWENYGYKAKFYRGQQDCNPYFNDGNITLTNKYSIKEWSHDRFHEKLMNRHPLVDPHGVEMNEMLFDEFVKLVQAQDEYNARAGKTAAITIIGYHSIDNSKIYDTSINLFDKEMNYLYQNGYTVLKLTDMDYNEKENSFYIK